MAMPINMDRVLADLPQNLEDLKLGELRGLAKDRDVKGQSTMRKPELIKALDKTRPQTVTGLHEVEPGVPQGASKDRVYVLDQSVADTIEGMRESIQQLGTQLYALEQTLQGGNNG